MIRFSKTRPVPTCVHVRAASIQSFGNTRYYMPSFFPPFVSNVIPTVGKMRTIPVNKSRTDRLTLELLGKISATCINQRINLGTKAKSDIALPRGRAHYYYCDRSLRCSWPRAVLVHCTRDVAINGQDVITYLHFFFSFLYIIKIRILKGIPPCAWEYC